ncbi:MAG: response regulator transcription factor [Chitinophagaceae bacterium]|jgi:DNA-binding NarL/FixJ family response regulator|nr:response regulator transcription factor [Chitinophagaceae bacterium]
MKQTIRILIVDDHPFFSEGLINALGSYPEYIVVAAIQNGNDVASAIKQYEPDILILDLNLPGTNGVALFPRLKKDFPALKIMILSMYMPADIRMQPEKELIDGYVVKNSGTDVLITALHELASGNRYFDPIIKSSNHHSGDDFSRKLKLSSRETEILQLLKEGYSNKEISQKLFLSELTVKTHRKNIMAKMDAKNIADLLRKGN